MTRQKCIIMDSGSLENGNITPIFTKAAKHSSDGTQKRKYYQCITW